MSKRREGSGNAAGARGRRIDFLGYCFTFESIRMRKSIKKNFAKKAKYIKNPEKRRQALASYWGWCKWADCRHLWKKVTKNDMSFKQVGIQPKNTTKEGKRIFNATDVRIHEIMNLPIKVVDFETGVKTREGEDRYVVLCEYDGGDMNGNQFKFITNSYEIKDVLDQAREMQKSGKTIDGKPIFPRPTKVGRRSLGNGKYSYFLE